MKDIMVMPNVFKGLKATNELQDDVKGVLYL